MNTYTQSNVLPEELTVAILEKLQCRDLLTCRLVSQQFKNIIDSSSSFQYEILLAATGMSDNPLNRVPTADKLSLIARYDAGRTSSFISTSQRRGEKNASPMRDGPAWELAGGVLAQSIDQYNIYFRQLPAIKRGIPEKTWNVSLAFPHADFTMDPGQDLLVIAGERSVGQSEVRLHLLRMSDGEPHPLARRPILQPSTDGHLVVRYEIRISGPYLGLFVSHIGALEPASLTVWNWHTGHVHMEIASHRIVSFVFLNDSKLLILAHGDSPLGKNIDDLRPPTSISLHVVNFTSGVDGPSWLLGFPSLNITTENIIMELTSDPGPLYVPHGGAVPPFHVLDVDDHTGGERVVVLNIMVFAATISFTTLASKLIALTQSYPMLEGDTWRHVPWAQWGPQSCCTDYSKWWSGVWVCVVYGTRHVLHRPNRNHAEGILVVRDFCERRLKWEETRRSRPWESQSAPVTHPTDDPQPSVFGQILGQQILPTFVRTGDNRLRYPALARMLGNLFSEDISTGLPYIEIEMPCAISSRDQVMLSEDSVVIVKNGNREATEFEVYSV